MRAGYLATQTPEVMPEVMAVDADRGWMLMRGLDAVDLGDQDQSLWQEGLMAHARIQQSWLGRTDELVALGLPVRSLTDLAGHVEAMTNDPVLLGRMPADVCERWLRTAPTLAVSCRRLEEIGPGPTLVPGDFHPWNVASGRPPRASSTGPTRPCRTRSSISPPMSSGPTIKPCGALLPMLMGNGADDGLAGSDLSWIGAA